MLIHSSKELAEYLRDRRKRQKLSQAEIGDRVGIKQATISAFENNPEGTRMPNKKLGVDHAFDAFGYLCLGKFNLAKGESGTVTTHRVY